MTKNRIFPENPKRALRAVAKSLGKSPETVASELMAAFWAACQRENTGERN